MANVWDEVMRLSDTLGDKRDQVIRQSLAVETSKIYNAWQEKADTYLMNQELNSDSSYGFAKDQESWYDEELSKFQSEIRDDRVLKSFQQLASGHRSSFVAKATSAEITKVKQNHLETYDNSSSYLTGLIYSTPADQLDQVFEQEVLPQVKLLRDSAIPELRDSLKDKFQAVFQSYVGRKQNDLAESLAKNLITDQEYTDSMEKLRSLVNNNPEMIAGMSADAIKAMNQSLSQDVETGANKFKQRHKKELENDFEGEIQRAYDGEGLDPAFEEEFLRTHQDDPNYEVYKTKFELVKEYETFFLAKKDGDIGQMKQWLDIAQEQFDNADARGQEYQQLKSNLTELSAQYQETLLKLQNNTAEAFKRNEGVKIYKKFGKDTGNYVQYVDEIVSLAEKNGIDPSSVEFLDDSDLTNVMAQLASADADQVEALALNLKQKFDIRTGKGSNAFYNIVGQVIRKASEDKLSEKESAAGSKSKTDIASKAIALQYAGTPIFNDLILGSDLSLDESQVKYLGIINVDPASVRKKVSERLKPLIQSIRSQTEDGEQTQSLTNAYVDAISKASLNMMLKKDVNFFNTEDNNINYVIDQVQNKAFSFVETPRVSVRIPKDWRGKDYSSLSSTIQTKAFREQVIREAAKENGITELAGDASGIITNLPVEIENKIKAEQRKMTLQDIIDNAYVRTSPDNSGIYIYVELAGKRLPLRFSQTGFVGKTFEEIDLDPKYKRTKNNAQIQNFSPYYNPIFGGQ